MVGLDTLNEGHDGGRLCLDRLYWLETALEQARDKPTVLFMHHPPFLSGISPFDRSPMEGADALASIPVGQPAGRAGAVWASAPSRDDAPAGRYGQRRTIHGLRNRPRHGFGRGFPTRSRRSARIPVAFVDPRRRPGNTHDLGLVTACRPRASRPVRKGRGGGGRSAMQRPPPPLSPVAGWVTVPFRRGRGTSRWDRRRTHALRPGRRDRNVSAQRPRPAHPTSWPGSAA